MDIMLKSVPVAPFGCYMPWHLRDEDNPHGAACWFCDRAIAIPEQAKGKVVACLYCGLDKGFLPLVEIEP
jgi:hypothetical protein